MTSPKEARIRTFVQTFMTLLFPSFRSPLIALLLHHLFVFFLYFFTSGRKLGPTRPILGSELLIHVKCCFVPRENGGKSLRIDVVLACDWIGRLCSRKFNAGIPLTFLLTWTMVRTRPSIFCILSLIILELSISMVCLTSR